MRNRIFVSRRLRAMMLVLAALFCLHVVGFAQADESAGEVATGHNGMVATAHPLASEAALEMLKAGGNAVDAAVAAAFAIGVVEPDGSGIGGGGGMVIYLAETGQSFYINYYQKTSGSVSEINYDAETDRHTAKAVLVPGTVAGLTLALEKFGTLPLSKVLEPAIRYAEDGFDIDATLAQLLLDNIETLQIDSTTSKIFLDDGFPKMEGDLLTQPALASTLKKIAAKGRDGFYKGEVAEAMASTITEMGGAMTLEDLANFRAELTVPLKGTYRGYEILSANVPQSGVSIIQAMNMLENEDIAGLGHFSTSAETAHLLAETFRRAYADRWQFMGDPHFSKVPVNGMISKQFARERYHDINRYKCDPKQYRLTQAGNPSRYDVASNNDQMEDVTTSSKKTFNWSDDEDESGSSYDEWGEDLFDSWGGGKKKSDGSAGKGNKKKEDKKQKNASDVFDQSKNDDDDQEFDGGHTTHMSIIDKDGNMVALTQTLGTFFGAGITVEGVLFNCGMSNFSRSAVVNMAKPDMQPRSSISPTLVLKDGKPFCVIGSPGASRIMSTVVCLLVNIIDFDMDAVEANAAPRIYCQKYEDYLYLEGGISEEVRQQLERMGHTLRVYEGRDLFFGGAQLIIVDPATGTYYGSADPRRGGIAIGY